MPKYCRIFACMRMNTSMRLCYVHHHLLRCQVGIRGAPCCAVAIVVVPSMQRRRRGWLFLVFSFFDWWLLGSLVLFHQLMI